MTGHVPIECQACRLAGAPGQGHHGWGRCSCWWRRGRQRHQRGRAASKNDVSGASWAASRGFGGRQVIPNRMPGVQAGRRTWARAPRVGGMQLLVAAGTAAPPAGAGCVTNDCQAPRLGCLKRLWESTGHPHLGRGTTGGGDAAAGGGGDGSATSGGGLHHKRLSGASWAASRGSGDQLVSPHRMPGVQAGRRTWARAPRVGGCSCWWRRGRQRHPAGAGCVTNDCQAPAGLPQEALGVDRSSPTECQACRLAGAPGQGHRRWGGCSCWWRRGQQRHQRGRAASQTIVRRRGWAASRGFGSRQVIPTWAGAPRVGVMQLLVAAGTAAPPAGAGCITKDCQVPAGLHQEVLGINWSAPTGCQACRLAGATWARAPRVGGMQLLVAAGTAAPPAGAGCVTNDCQAPAGLPQEALGVNRSSPTECQACRLAGAPGQGHHGWGDAAAGGGGDSSATSGGGLRHKRLSGAGWAASRGFER